jgi:peptidyl-tRNA hydrolase
MKAIQALIAAATFAIAGSAFAEFKAEVKTEIEAKTVTQVGLAVGKSSVVQNGIGGVNTNGLKNADIKLDSKIKAGTITQVGLAVGQKAVVQNNLGSVQANAQ